MNTTASSLRALAFGDLDRELSVTRKVLERLPEDRFDWKVHEKSMPLGHLAQHVVNLLTWSLDTIQKDDLDLTTIPPMAKSASSRAALLQAFDQKSAAVREAIEALDDAALARPWTCRMGEKVLATQPRALILRVWCLSHLIHHRAQLCVYLRLLNVPVPAVYFNSSDEPEWQFT
ncbi:MAG TPA: DinB family protein [Tepidisphaeraceae bacterium]|jgi:uncharacterized damage-inducible protein DinB